MSINGKNAKRYWLIKVRKELNYKQDQVADAAGLSRTFYCQIENGSRNPSPAKAKKIAKFLNTDWTYFYSENENISNL